MCVHTCRNRKLPWTLFPVYMSPCLCAKKKRKSKTQQILLSCLTAGAQAWQWGQKARRRFPLPPLPSTCGGRATVPFPKGTGVRADGCVFPLRLHPEGSMISRQECVPMWEWVAGSGWGERSPSSISRKYTKEASTPENPSPYLPCSS